MRRRQLLAFLLLLFLIPCARAQTGTLELHNLPTYAEVYLNGRPLQRPDRLPTARWQVPAGEHELQVEAWINNRVMAFRRRVTVENGRTNKMNALLQPVVLSQQAPAPQGPPGAIGPRGRAGDPTGTSTRMSEAEVADLIADAVDILLRDLYYEPVRIENRFWRPQIHFYVYRPEPNVPAPFPYGPQGARGPMGISGIPGDVLRLRSEDGQSLLDKVKKELGITEIESGLAKLSQPELDFSKMISELTIRRSIPLYTPRWCEWMNTRDALAKRLPLPMVCVLGPTGTWGAPGPRGKDGEVPEDAPRIQLSEEQVQSLLEQLKADANLQNRIQQLNARVDELKHRVAPDGATSQNP